MSKAIAFHIALAFCAVQAQAAESTLQPDHLSIGSDLTYPPIPTWPKANPQALIRSS